MRDAPRLFPDSNALKRLQLPSDLPGSRHQRGLYLHTQCGKLTLPVRFALRVGDTHPVGKHPAHQVFMY